MKQLYVSKSGNDANNGLSWATAKLTIMAAVALFEDGDTINIGPGTFIEQVNGVPLSLHLKGSRYGDLGTVIFREDVGDTGTIVTGSSSLIEDLSIYTEGADAEGTRGIQWGSDCVARRCKFEVINSGVGLASATLGGLNNRLEQCTVIAGAINGTCFDCLPLSLNPGQVPKNVTVKPSVVIDT